MALSRLAAVAILCVFVFGSIAIGKQMERTHWEGIAVITSDSTGVFHGPEGKRRSQVQPGRRKRGQAH